MSNNRRPLAVYTDADGVDLGEGIQLLTDAGFDVEVLNTIDAEAIAIGAAGATVLMVGYAQISAELIARLPNLRLISVLSMGVNNIDIEAATEHGIVVANVVGVATEEVATHCLAITLAQVRQLAFYQQTVRAGAWHARARTAPYRLSECVLGIVGLGRIGTAFARLARPLFGSIVGCDSLLPNNAETNARLSSLGIVRASLEEVRDQAHVLSLHVPLTAETEGMVNGDFLASMRPGSILVNASRGGLVNSPDLAKSLDRGHLAGAALDVLDMEPPPQGHPLVGHGRVTLTPHIGFLSRVTDADYVRIHAENAIRWLRSGTPVHPVNLPNGTVSKEE